MTLVSFTVRTGKALWGNVDYSHPDDAVLLGVEGETINIDDESPFYQEALLSPAVNCSRAPTAEFTSDVTTGAAPLTVHFSDMSLDADAWAWNFGDAGTSSLQNPSHTYTDAGTYTVQLSATNSYDSENLITDLNSKVAYITVT